MQKDHRTFDKERLRNQPLTKEISKVPVRASEEYGWNEPLDPFNNMGYGIKSVDGGVVFHTINKNAGKLKKKD